MAYVSDMSHVKVEMEDLGQPISWLSFEPRPLSTVQLHYCWAKLHIIEVHLLHEPGHIVLYLMYATLKKKYHV
jgi:hypothetical protein